MPFPKEFFPSYLRPHDGPWTTPPGVYLADLLLRSRVRVDLTGFFYCDPPELPSMVFYGDTEWPSFSHWLVPNANIK